MKFQYTDDVLFPIKYPKGFEGYVKKILPKSFIYDRFKKRAFCTACEKKFAYKIKFSADEYILCPECGARTHATPHTRGDLARTEIMLLQNEGKNEVGASVLSCYWRVRKNTNPDDIEICVNIYPEEQIFISNNKQTCSMHWGKNTWYDTGVPYVHHQINTINIFPNIKATLKRNFLMYMPTERHVYDADYLTKKMCFFAKYPQAEYVSKAGFEDFINKKICRIPTYVRVNWKASDMANFWKLTHQDIDKMKQWGMYDVESIAWYQLLKKYGHRITKNMINEVKEGSCDLSEYNKNFKNHDPLKIQKYIQKVYEDNIPQCRHGMTTYTKGFVIREYIDYFRQLNELGYPINDYYKYPKNFIEAHERVSAEYNAKLDAEQKERNRKKNEKYKKRLEELQTLSYCDETYLIKPLEGFEDFIKEGRENRNCVASYFDRAAEGSTNIFVIRKKESPEITFVTLELDAKKESIKQCYASGNTFPTQEVTEFAKFWLENIVKSNKKGKIA